MKVQTDLHVLPVWRVRVVARTNDGSYLNFRCTVETRDEAFSSDGELWDIPWNPVLTRPNGESTELLPNERIVRFQARRHGKWHRVIAEAEFERAYDRGSE